MSRVPTAVRQKAQSADDMIRANAAAAKGGADAGALSTGQELDTEVRATTADIVPISSIGAAAPTGEAGGTGTMQDVALETIAHTAQEVAEYKQRWKSLDGQLRQRDAQLAAQADQIARLTDLVSNMAAGQSQVPQGPQVPAGVLASDEEDFGPDMIQFVTRLVDAGIQRVMGNLQSRFDNLEHTVADVSHSTAGVVRKSFQDQLTEYAPRWKEFDTAQEFHDWLALSTTRNNAFFSAVADKDAVAVADYFNMFVALLPPPAPVPGSVTQQPAPSPLELQVAPARSRTSAPAVASTTEPKIWTRTEIAMAYADRGRGKYPDAEWHVLEQEISAAQRDQRVDYTR